MPSIMKKNSIAYNSKSRNSIKSNKSKKKEFHHISSSKTYKSFHFVYQLAT